MAYDNVISHIGEFGKYQRRIFLLLFSPAIPAAFHSMAGVFLGAQPDYRCLLPNEYADNATYNLEPNLMRMAYPRDEITGNWFRCERYELNLTSRYNMSDESPLFTNNTVQCDSFVYDKTNYELTATTEFNLVCDNAWLKATADALFMVGIMLGTLIFGGLSDRYGRRSALCLIMLVNFISGLLVAAAPEMISYMIFRMVLGTTTKAMYQVAYIIAVEMVVPNRRLLVTVTLQLVYACGYVLTAAFPYFIENWRIVQIAISVPSLVILSYCWLIPESVRWLLTKGRSQEAKALILKASSVNGVELTKDTLDCMIINNYESRQQRDDEKPSVLDLFRHPNLRRKTLLLFLNWFVITATYYGLSWNTSNLGGNDYINFTIAGLVEIPATAFVFFTLNRFGRRIMLCGCMMLAGISLLSIIFVSADTPWIVVLLAMIGKLVMTSSMEIIYIFSAEQYPTVIRSVGVGVCSGFARIGGVIAPYILHLSSIWAPLPYIIFGTGSLITGLSALLLPETLNQRLPESINDGEEFGKKRKIIVAEGTELASRDRPMIVKSSNHCKSPSL